jgi:hypothetical protein
LLLAAASTAAAQQQYRVTAPENLRVEPNTRANVLARVSEGSELRGGETREGWVSVTLDGWIWQRSVRASRAGGFALAVSASDGENLRAEPNGRVVARLGVGTLLEEVSRRDGWIRVRRSAWMWGGSLTAVEGAAGGGRDSATTAPRTADSVPAGPGLDQQTLSAGTRLLTAPGGDTLGVLAGRGTARVVARSDGWARVLVEAWVRDADLAPAGDSVLLGITGAEVRGGGRTFEGRTLRWTLQFIAVQTADELRRDMPPGQRYALMRGPLPESGFVYVLLTPEQARALAQLEPLERLTVLGRVRTARSLYLGNPILDLLAVASEREQ